jgi:cysteine desulfurase
VAAHLGRRPSEVIFTSGGSEADNLALSGVLERAAEPRRLVLSAVEHPAVDAAARSWAERGVDVARVPVLPSGALDLSALERALEIPTTLVSVMAVNNETGFVHDIPAVRELSRRAGARLHVDAVQAGGRLPVSAFDADLVVMSGHKLGGLPGAGVLALRDDIPLAPAVVGGPQERGKRAGTESVAAAVALAEALERAESKREAENARLARLRDRLDDALRALPGVAILDRGPRVAGVTTAVFDDVDGEVLLQALDLEGVAASSGSACSSGSLEPSHVLLALGVDPARALSAVRFSLGWATTEDEVEEVARLLPGLLDRARRA